ncbi:MAG TPA: hypothetical protein PK171_01495 [Atribacter sp.]|nr:hypothetical protein [Atribacter sp.]
MDYKVMLDTIWVIIASMLVFFMNLGFAMVEPGFNRSKKHCQYPFKEFYVFFAVSTLGFLVLGWVLMFGSGGGAIHCAPTILYSLVGGLIYHAREFSG